MKKWKNIVDNSDYFQLMSEIEWHNYVDAKIEKIKRKYNPNTAMCALMISKFLNKNK